MNQAPLAAPTGHTDSSAMSADEREALTTSRTSYTNPEDLGGLGRGSTAQRLQRQSSRQRARQMARMANHPLDAQSRRSMRLALGQSFICVLQLAFILSALMNDGWDARWCDKPLALWLEVHAGILIYDLIPIWAVFVLPADQLARLTNTINSLKCIAGVFRLVWAIVGTEWVFATCENSDVGAQVHMVAMVIVIVTWAILGITMFCCCCCLPLLLAHMIATNPDEFIAQMAANQVRPPAACDIIRPLAVALFVRRILAEGWQP
eukprot:SAG11_NODE_1969_length_3985_cov_2.930777_2_plen_264_part_00